MANDKTFSAIKFNKTFQQLLTGEMCCYDLSAAEFWKVGEVRWSKRCCNNPSGHPVTRPDKPFSPQHLSKVSIETDHASLYGAHN